ALQVDAVTHEDRVLAHDDVHVQVARRATALAGLAFSGQPDAIARVDAGRHLHLDGARVAHAALAPAGGTGIGDDPPGAAALRAGLLHREEALLHAHLADAVAARAGNGRGTGARTGSAAGFALHQLGHAHLEDRKSTRLNSSHV